MHNISYCCSSLGFCSKETFQALTFLKLMQTQLEIINEDRMIVVYQSVCLSVYL